MDKDQTINFNHNAAECIKGTYKLGSTIYKNICNGSISTVDWGGTDWLFAFLLTIFAIAIILIVLGFAKVIWKDTF
jgi:hypothetical protein